MPITRSWKAIGRVRTDSMPSRKAASRNGRWGLSATALNATGWPEATIAMVSRESTSGRARYSGDRPAAAPRTKVPLAWSSSLMVQASMARSSGRLWTILVMTWRGSRTIEIIRVT